MSSDLEDLIDTSQLAVDVQSDWDSGIVLLNFGWRVNGVQRWLWEDSVGRPMYEMCEAADIGPLMRVIHRLHEVGVLTDETAEGAMSLIRWERDRWLWFDSLHASRPNRVVTSQKKSIVQRVSKWLSGKLRAAFAVSK